MPLDNFKGTVGLNSTLNGKQMDHKLSALKGYIWNKEHFMNTIRSINGKITKEKQGPYRIARSLWLFRQMPLGVLSVQGQRSKKRIFCFKLAFFFIKSD